MLDGLDDISYGIAHITFIVTFKFTLKLVRVSSVIAPHCLMSDSNPAPEYYIFYITGVDAAGIGIERLTA